MYRIRIYIRQRLTLKEYRQLHWALMPQWLDQTYDLIKTSLVSEMLFLCSTTMQYIRREIKLKNTKSNCEKLAAIRTVLIHIRSAHKFNKYTILAMFETHKIVWFGNIYAYCIDRKWLVGFNYYAGLIVVVQLCCLVHINRRHITTTVDLKDHFVNKGLELRLGKMW